MTDNQQFSARRGLFYDLAKLQLPLRQHAIKRDEQETDRNTERS